MEEKEIKRVFEVYKGPFTHSHNRVWDKDNRAILEVGIDPNVPFEIRDNLRVDIVILVKNLLNQKYDQNENKNPK